MCVHKRTRANAHAHAREKLEAEKVDNNNFFCNFLVICYFLVIFSKRLLNPSFSEKPKKGGRRPEEPPPPFFLFSQLMDSEAILKVKTKNPK